MDSIHRPVFYLKHNVSEAEFCLRSQVESTQLDPMDKANGPETETYSVYCAQLSRFHLKTEMKSSLRNAIF
jgi:hypothetical protein